MVDILLLGCGGGMPMPNRFLSSTLINYKGRKILIDCGEGTQVAMKIFGSGFKFIDVICITHGHGDHINGLPGLLATIGNSGRTEPITIIGPKGIEDIVGAIRIMVPYLPYEINVIENTNMPLSIMEDIVVSTLELNHSADCIGYSFYFKRKPKFDVDMAKTNNIPKVFWNILQKGETVTDKGITYEPCMVLGGERAGIKVSLLTDTRPVEIAPDFIKESDLFICEGTYGDNKDLDKAIKNKHMTFSEAAQLAYEGNVHELLLTHFSPSICEPESFKQNAINIFEKTIIGKDGTTKSISFRD